MRIFIETELLCDTCNYNTYWISSRRLDSTLLYKLLTIFSIIRTKNNSFLFAEFRPKNNAKKNKKNHKKYEIYYITLYFKFL